MREAGATPCVAPASVLCRPMATRLRRGAERRIDLRRRRQVLRERLERVLRALGRDLRAERVDLDAGRLQRVLGRLAGGHLTLDLALEVGNLTALFLDGG